MDYVREDTPELDVLWRERPAPPREPKKKDYRLLKSRITNLILLGLSALWRW